MSIYATLWWLKYEKELRAKAEEIAALNREITGSVTGGDSFAFFEFQITPKTNDAMVYLACHGNYSCFDVFATVSDNEETRDRLRRLGLQGGGFITNQQMRALKPKGKFIMSMIRPQTSIRVQDRWLLPTDTDSVTYYMDISTRNGRVSQLFKLRRGRAANP